MPDIFSYLRFLEDRICVQLRVQMPDLIQNYRFYFDDVNFCEVEFHSPKLNVYGKIYIHIDGLKLHNKDKLLKHCLKMIAIGDALGKSNRRIKKIIILTEAAIREEANRSWIGYIAKKYKIELRVLELPEKEKHRIRLLKEYHELQRQQEYSRKLPGV